VLVLEEPKERLREETDALVWQSGLLLLLLFKLGWW
jgi:hypothetical protein